MRNTKLKRNGERFLVQNESIILVLDVYSYKLYGILRLEVDFSKECGSAKRTVDYLKERCGFSRNKVYQSLNLLESLGLLKREGVLGDTTTYIVAQNLYHFNENSKDRGVSEKDRGVSEKDRGVSHRDTDQYSLQESIHKNTYSPPEEDEVAVIKKSKKKEPDNELMKELIEIYNHELREFDVTKHSTHPLRPDVVRTINKTISEWNKNFENKFSKENFANYLRGLAATNHWLLQPYETKGGKWVTKGIPVICRWEMILRARDEALTESKRNA